MQQPPQNQPPTAPPAMLLQLDTSKAGMSAVKKEDIEKIINEASAGSPFYANEERKKQIRAAKHAETIAKIAPLRSMLEARGTSDEAHPIPGMAAASTTVQVKKQMTLSGFMKVTANPQKKDTSKREAPWPTDPTQQVSYLVVRCDMKEREFVLSVAEFELKKIRGGWRTSADRATHLKLHDKRSPSPASSGASSGLSNSAQPSEQIFLPTLTFKAPTFFGVFAHIDMDAFFAAVEEKDNPALKGVPFAVGGMSMLSTSNYEARKFGVRAAMPGYLAKKLCPNLQIVQGQYGRYQEESDIFKGIIAEYDPNYSSGGIDEAGLNLLPYLLRKRQWQAADDFATRHSYAVKAEPDCTTSHQLDSDDEPLLCDDGFASTQPPAAAATPNPSATVTQATDTHIYIDVLAELPMFLTMAGEVLQEMRAKIFQATQLTASAGVAYTRCLAKVMSNKRKPNGQYTEEVPQADFEWILHGGDEHATNPVRSYMHMRHLKWAEAEEAKATPVVKSEPKHDVVSPPHKSDSASYCPIALRMVSYVACNVVGMLKPRDIPFVGKASEEQLVSLGVRTCADLFHLRYVLYHAITPKTFDHILTIALGCMGSWGGGFGTTSGEQNRDGFNHEDQGEEQGSADDEDCNDDGDAITLGQKRNRDNKSVNDSVSTEPTLLDRKSLSVDRTFSQCRDQTELIAAAMRVTNKAVDRLLEEGLTCRHVSLKLKGTNYHVHQSSEALPLYIIREDFEQASREPLWADDGEEVNEMVGENIQGPTPAQSAATSTTSVSLASAGPLGIRKTMWEVISRMLGPHLANFSEYRLLGVRCGLLLMSSEAVAQNALLLAPVAGDTGGRSPTKQPANNKLNIAEMFKRKQDEQATAQKSLVVQQHANVKPRTVASVCELSDDDDVSEVQIRSPQVTALDKREAPKPLPRATVPTVAAKCVSVPTTKPPAHDSDITVID